jgi:predicted MFS family arabinose efflux permease
MQADRSAAMPPHHKWYALGLLIVVALFNYIDRQSLSILQVPIKHDLGLSDTELGALTGLSFALLYSTLALPIARLADRARRTYIIAAALAVWSVMTGGSGLAMGFGMLVFCRMGVALGEAGCVPATHALIADYFPRERRATAIAIWTLSFPLGTMLGFAASGWLNDAVGWRDTFLVLGCAGVALVPLLLLTLREPMRGATDQVAAAAVAPPLWRAVQILWNLRAFRHATWAAALLSYALYAMLNWNAPFYSRVYGVPMRSIAEYMALATGLGGGIGTYLAGAAADRLGRRDPRWYMWVPALAALCTVPAMLLQYLTADLRVSLAAGALGAVLVNSYLPPLVATAQSLVGPNLRAFTSAVMVLVVNIVGIGLGPLVTGMISDRLVSSYGIDQESLRYAILASAPVALWGAWHFRRAASFLPAELPGRAAVPAEAPPALRNVS